MHLETAMKKVLFESTSIQNIFIKRKRKTLKFENMDNTDN